MNRSEIQPIKELAEQRRKHATIVSQNQKLATNLDLPLGEGGFTITPSRKSIKPGMSMPQAKEVGLFNIRTAPEKVEYTKQRLRDKIAESTASNTAQVQEVDHAIEELAPLYNTVFQEITRDVTELTEVWAQGGLTDEEFAPFKEEFDEVASLPDQLPGLKKGIEMLEEDKQAKSKYTSHVISLKQLAEGWARPQGTGDDNLINEIAAPTKPSASHWLDNVYTDPVNAPTTAEASETGAEKGETKVKIYLLPENKLKIGERVINPSGKHTSAQKDYSEERIKALTVLIKNQGKFLSPHEIWEEAFPGTQFNRDTMTQIKSWFDKFITYRWKNIVAFNGKRGLGSRYGITDFDVELIEPGKRQGRVEAAASPKQQTDKAFGPKTDDEYTLPTGETFRGLSASLVRVAVEQLSNPMLYITSDDLVLYVHGAPVDIEEKNRLINLWRQVRKSLREKHGIDVRSNFKPGYQKEEVKYWAVRSDEEILDELRGTVRLVPQPTGSLAEKLLGRQDIDKPTQGDDRPQPVEIFRFHDQSEVRGEAARLLRLVQNHLTSDPQTSLARVDMAIAMFGAADEGALSRLDTLVTATNKLLDLRAVGFSIATGAVEIRGEQIERYYRQKTSGAEIKPETTEPDGKQPIETIEDKIQRLTPTPEEAALLAGYLELRKDILGMLGIEPLASDIYDALEATLGEESHRSVDDIQRLRRSALQKSIELIENRLLNDAIDKLALDDPRSGLLIYLLSIQNEAVVLEMHSLPEGELMSAFDFLKLLVESNTNLTGELDARTYRLGDNTTIVLTSPHGHAVSFNIKYAPEDNSARQDQINNEKGGDSSRAEVILFDHEKPVTTDPEAGDQSDREAMDELSDAGADVTPRQLTPEELAAAFLASEKAKRKDRPEDQAVIEQFADDIRILYQQLGGLDPNGVSVRTFRGRFPYVQNSDIKNAFENNIISENLSGGKGGIQLTHEAMVRILFHVQSKGEYSAKPYKKAFEQGLKQVKKERDRKAADDAARGDEDQFIEG